MSTFDRGDIVRVNLEPVVGREMQGTARPALVLTPKAFNALGDVLVAPIIQGGNYARYAGFAVPLMGSGCKTQGVVLLNKCRMLDLNARSASKIERAPQEIVEDALGRLMTIFE